MIQFSLMGNANTSQSHPLKIEPVPIRDGRGVIGLTFCPGKKHVGSYSGEWNRDLGIDLQAIQAFGASALVTLMEPDEMEAVKVPVDSLKAATRELDLEWHHLPVKDVEKPDDQFKDLWAYSGLRLRNLLARGEKVVVHCRGGLGRTGTIAGQLLVEFGDEPPAAIKKVRAARPGAIETSGQEKYVKDCKPVTFARVEKSQEERALACLLGGAVGDALGYEVEFKSLKEIQERFGEHGIKTPVRQHGRLIVSDDTQMTLFTMEGIVRSVESRSSDQESRIISSIREAYLDWYNTQQGGAKGKQNSISWLVNQPVMHARRAPGNTCLSALGAGGKGTLERPINNSKGCGGIMRTAPIGLIGPGADAETVFRLAATAAALTHGHPSGYLSAGIMASILYLLVEGHRLVKPGSFYSNSAIEKSCEILRGYSGYEETLTEVKRAITLAAQGLTQKSFLGVEDVAGHGFRSHAEVVQLLGDGWVGEEALAIAVYAVLSADSFVEAISIAASHSGDSDSTASIAGQLWGAMHGLGGIPHDWIMDLDVLVPLLHLSRQLISVGFR